MEEDFISKGRHGFCPRSRYICLAVIVGWAAGCDSCWNFRKETNATNRKPTESPRQLNVGSFSWPEMFASYDVRVAMELPLDGEKSEVKKSQVG
ncbi:hypothetical protein B0T13DRAFT_224175 [Neurospora crassa]|nr:hypothetical protein B0T13DRAFT_224175 [Neurospora crassa]